MTCVHDARKRSGGICDFIRSLNLEFTSSNCCCRKRSAIARAEASMLSGLRSEIAAMRNYVIWFASSNVSFSSTL